LTHNDHEWRRRCERIPPVCQLCDSAQVVCVSGGVQTGRTGQYLAGANPPVTGCEGSEGYE